MEKREIFLTSHTAVLMDLNNRIRAKTTFFFTLSFRVSGKRLSTKCSNKKGGSFLIFRRTKYTDLPVKASSKPLIKTVENIYHRETDRKPVIPRIKILGRPKQAIRPRPSADVFL